MKFVMGIDPGLQGAIALVDEAGELRAIHDMPVQDEAGERRTVCAKYLTGLIRLHAPALVVIEGVGSRPGEGHVGAFSFGYGAGILEGVVKALGIEVRIIDASRWKGFARVSGNKKVARKQASATFPDYAEKFKREKDDGRADAALLARWGALQLLQHIKCADALGSVPFANAIVAA